MAHTSREDGKMSVYNHPGTGGTRSSGPCCYGCQHMGTEYTQHPTDSYESNRLVEEFKIHNIDVRIINPTEIDIFVNKDNKSSILVNGESLPLPKFVFPRTGSGTTYYIKAVIRHFERMGVVVINGSEAIETVKDKLYTQQILAQLNLDAGLIFKLN